MEFPGFLGNLEVKQAISAALASGRFPHAVAISGEPGSGRRTLALLLARALVCEDEGAAPCGVCSSCRRALAGSHPDIRIIEGSGRPRSLSVDTVKNMTQDAYKVPENSDFSIYIVILEGTASSSATAQNKLLKLVEEPPEGAVFIFVCETPETLLPTIRSRVQSFTLYPPSEKEAADWLCEHTDEQPERAAELARLCGGNIGRMLKEMNDENAKRAYDTALAIADAMTVSGEHELLRAAAPLLPDREKELFREVLSRLTLIFRDACVLRMGGSSILSGAEKCADRLADLPKSCLVKLPEITEEFKAMLDRNANPALLVTALCARLREAVGR